MRQLVLVGAGAHGRGVLEILRARAAESLPVPEVVGFVDDAPATWGGTVGGLPVLGGVDWLVERAATHDAILALASARAKEALALRLDAAGIGYATAVHPRSVLGTGVLVGPGSVINAGAVIAYDTRIGRHVTVNLNATVGHDCLIGDFSTIAPGVNITGRVTLVLGCEVQTNATIVPGLTIGAFAAVGPASLVLRDVPEGVTVAGNPARRIPV